MRILGRAERGRKRAIKPEIRNCEEEGRPPIIALKTCATKKKKKERSGKASVLALNGSDIFKRGRRKERSKKVHILIQFSAALNPWNGKERKRKVFFSPAAHKEGEGISKLNFLSFHFQDGRGSLLSFLWHDDTSDHRSPSSSYRVQGLSSSLLKEEDAANDASFFSFLCTHPQVKKKTLSQTP